MRITEKLAARNKDFLANRPIVIACLGDSVTHGCFEVFIDERNAVDTVYRPQSSYAAKLGTRLSALYPRSGVNVVNAGVSGDNAPGGLKRLERDVLRVQPDLVIVNFGLNDSLNPDQEAGLRAYREAMTEIFQKVLASRAECMLLTPNRMCAYVSHALVDDTLRGIAADVARAQNDGVLSRYVDEARRVAWREGVPVADAYERWQQLEAHGVDTTALLSNSINHPSEEMHDLFVECILGVMMG